MTTDIASPLPWPSRFMAAVSPVTGIQTGRLIYHRRDIQNGDVDDGVLRLQGSGDRRDGDRFAR